MEKKLVKVLTPGRLIRLFGFVLAVFLVLAGFLYWQGYIKGPGFILVGAIAIVVGISFIIGVRVAQRDGFLDGYVRAKDDLDRKKE